MDYECPPPAPNHLLLGCSPNEQKARRHTQKTLGPVSFPTTCNPLTRNSLFLEGAAPFLATGVRMQHGTAVHTRVPEPDCLGSNTGPASYLLYNLYEPHNGKLPHRAAVWRGWGTAHVQHLPEPQAGEGLAG